MESTKPIRVLLVDDDRDFNDTIGDFLRTNGYEVTVAEDGVAGLRAIMAGEYDVLLVDMVMPNLPGDAFYHAVQRVKPHLCDRVIFITAHLRNPKVSAFLKQVAAPSLIKPFKFEQLMETISRQLAKTVPAAQAAPGQSALAQ